MFYASDGNDGGTKITNICLPTDVKTSHLTINFNVVGNFVLMF